MCVNIFAATCPFLRSSRVAELRYNAHKVSGAGFPPGTTVTAFCGELELHGSEVRTSQSNGRWDGEEATCQEGMKYEI